ncbi:MAG: lysylphosphatidylglycerol synthase transmembrane domain-containing protein [Solirubrobacteraceae bacterium]
MERRAWRRPVTVLIAAVAVALLLWVAPPGEVLHQLDTMRLSWLLAAVGFELASCLSYIVLFRGVFPELPRRTCWRVAWIAMGTGAVLPGGNAASAVSTGLLLRNQEPDARSLTRRCVAILCLLTGLGFFASGVAATLVLLGVDSRPYNLLHALGPIAVSAVVLGGAALLVLGTRRLGTRAPGLLRKLACGLEAGWCLLYSRQWQLLGAAGYAALDMAALWAACRATGHPLGAPALVLAYCIGYLATMIPVPAGIGVLDTGLSGSLVLYGVAGPAAVGAVLVYHLISVWIPGLGGLIAWLPSRIARVAGPLAGNPEPAAPVPDAHSLAPV